MLCVVLAVVLACVYVWATRTRSGSEGGSGHRRGQGMLLQEATSPLSARRAVLAAPAAAAVPAAAVPAAAVPAAVARKPAPALAANHEPAAPPPAAPEGGSSSAPDSEADRTPPDPLLRPIDLSALKE